MYLSRNTNVVGTAGTIQYMSNIGSKISAARQALGMSQGQLASKAGVTQGTIGHLESGRNQTSTKLPQIAAALGLTVEDLIRGKEPNAFEPNEGYAMERWPFKFERGRFDRLSVDRKRKLELLILGQIAEWEASDGVEQPKAG